MFALYLDGQLFKSYLVDATKSARSCCQHILCPATSQSMIPLARGLRLGNCSCAGPAGVWFLPTDLMLIYSRAFKRLYFIGDSPQGQ
jgi:hypothetical protein